MIPPIFEPIGAGIAVAIFNKYILNKSDPFAYCYAQCCHKEEDDDCVYLRGQRRLPRPSFLKSNKL